MATLHEKADLALRQSESALLAAARKSGKAEVSRADLARFTSEFMTLLDERVPASLASMRDRIQALETGAAAAVANPPVAAEPPGLAALVSRVVALETVPPPPAPTPVAPPPPPPPPVAPGPPPLTATLTGPSNHHGRKFKFRMETNRPLTVSYRVVRDIGFRGVRVTGARRLYRRSDFWEITAVPVGAGAAHISTTRSLRDGQGNSVATTRFIVDQ